MNVLLQTVHICHLWKSFCLMLLELMAELQPVSLQLLWQKNRFFGLQWGDVNQVDGLFCTVLYCSYGIPPIGGVAKSSVTMLSKCLILELLFIQPSNWSCYFATLFCYSDEIKLLLFLTILLYLKVRKNLYFYMNTVWGRLN